MRGLLLGLFGFAGFFATVSLLVTRTDVATAFAGALAVTLLIQGATLLVLRRVHD
jgi:nitrate reductase gamma subunit